MRRLIRQRQRRLGSSLVELAFIAPVFLLLIFGMLEYARFFYTMQVMNNAAREGARYAVVNTNDTTKANVQTYVDGYLSGVGSNQLTGYNPTTSIDVYEADPTTGADTGTPFTGAGWGTAVGVTVTGTYKPILPGFLFLPGNVTITSTCVMTTEAN
jgi:Flp pilus assembly protein TadG